MKHIVWIAIAIVSLNCNNDKKESGKVTTTLNSDNCFVYPSVVDSLGVHDLYDSTRWYVYTWECDGTYLPKSDTTKSITFGELPLQFKDLSLKNDTLMLNFFYLDEQTPILTSMTRDNKELVTGVVFNIKTKKKISMSFGGGTITISGGDNRFQNTLHPEVALYLEHHWAALNNCFKKLAEKNGVTSGKIDY
ncbi:MAG: hypothetical protein BGO54_04075 [Sphingobacteriales bacterium 46-32]|nr:MAG: hypothetical protein BGO54_04075 [Sphingobacteriales bacterium 46-32]